MQHRVGLHLRRQSVQGSFRRHAGESYALCTDACQRFRRTTRCSCAAREQGDNACALHLEPLLTKVAFGLERPLETACNPVGEPVDVDGKLAVDLRTPGRKVFPEEVEAIDTVLAEIAHEIDGRLEIQALLLLHDNNHVVRVAWSGECVRKIVGRYK